MKYNYIILFTLTLFSCSVKTTKNNQEAVTNIDLTNKIIGVWEFVRTTDTNGNKLDSYQGSFGTVEATGPKLIYNKNKTYTMVFTPKNSDKGYWRFNPKNSTIEHDLYIDSTDWVGKDLIRQKLAIKKSDGKYYELIEDKIFKLQNDEMWIDNRGLIDIFKKIK